MHPVTYIGRKLLPREKRYAIIEREFLAIVWAVGKLSCYLLGDAFYIETDSKPLTPLPERTTIGQRQEMALVADALQATVGASEPWPDDVLLYQQYKAEQITLPDCTQCLAVEAFLRMCGLRFNVKCKTNAEEMSPSGKVPFIQAGPYLVSEFEPVVGFVARKGFSLSRDMSDTDRSEMRAYMSMLENILGNAELYMAWFNPEISNEVTKPRYGCSYPWPLNWVLAWKKQRAMIALLTANDWASKTVEEVTEEVHTCCLALSEKLDKKKYFFGDSPTELDALVYGHLYTLLTTKLPGGPFTSVIREFQNLAEFCKRVDSAYFSD
ncbi:metaxin-2 [Elysia marginata]|uniref:Metaxin-2 n=1 Tax=Elysia marginata TaxID=1093978 RepID=A0AAV4I189_9GAST|nr:metaxin-2 [Elysia marginata]